MAGAQIKTSLGKVLLSIKQRLIDHGVFEPTAVWISLRMKPHSHDQASTYGIILPLTQQTMLGTGDGAGRYAKRVRCRFNVYVRTQLDLDEANRDEQWLTHATIGAIATWDKVEDALEGVFLLSEQGDYLTVEPVRHIFTAEPHKSYESSEWGDVNMEFETQYLRDLDLTTDQ